MSLCILLSEHLFAQVLEEAVSREGEKKKKEEKWASEVPAAGSTRICGGKKITKWLFLGNVFMQLLIPEHIPS